VKALRSLRVRLLIGSVLWTLGILFLANFVTFNLVRRYANTQHGARARGGLQFVIVTHPSGRPQAAKHWMALALTCLAAGLWQIRGAVSPLFRLRSRVADVRDGREQRVEGSYPTEVQPLVNEVNALLEHRETQVSRALAKAGDLAHGLKTPLAVLRHEAERAEAAGQTELAAAIEQQVERMQRQLDYHLAHARAAASGATLGAHASVKESAEGLVRTLSRIHASRGLAFHVSVPPEHSVPVEREDLDEMLGNLLDNACKWGRTRVDVSSARENGFVIITVDDDGRGLEPSMRDAVLQRGVRADEAAPGFGFGLAIVRDLATLYGGAITLSDSPLGGLRAMLRLPG
jgi:signal transduction histidine kinase